MTEESLVENPVRTPEHLIGVGGSGSDIVERFMKRTWILDTKLNPEIGSDVPELHARTVDSATSENERNERLTAEKDIQEDIIEEKVEQYDLTRYKVDFEHYNYVENTSGSVLDNQGLTSRRGINDALQDAEAASRIGNAWWLEDDQKLVGQAGFNNGVQRRRALSKALYHLSGVHETGGSKTHPKDYRVQSGDQVAMVVALGGGTGSGSFIDIARDFADDAEVQLFCIIPDSGYRSGITESVDEVTSAYAALSELEAMQVNGESPFQSVILMPFNQSQNTDHYEEAVVDTILSYFGLLSEDDNGANRAIPGRADAINTNFSFITAIPKIIEYDAGLRKDAKESLNDHLAERRQQLQVESNLYEVVKEYLENNFADSFDPKLNPDGIQSPEFNLDDEAQEKKVLAMSQRLEEKLQGSLLGDDSLSVAGIPVEKIFDKLAEQYRNLDVELSEAPADEPPYERVETERDSEYARDIVSDLPENIENHLIPNEFDGDLEREVVQLIHKEVKNVKKRRDLLRAIYATRPDKITGQDTSSGRQIKRALAEVVLNSDAQSLRPEFTNDELTTLKDQTGRELYRDEIHYVQLEQYSRKVSQEFRDALNDWWEQTRVEFETIANYDTHLEEIEEHIEQLDSSCGKIADKLSNENLAADALDNELPHVDGDDVDIDSLNDLLEAVGVDERVDRSEIESHIGTLIRAKSAKEDYPSNRGPFGIFGSDEDAEGRFRAAATDIEESPYFNLANGTDVSRNFSVSVATDFSYLLDDIEDSYDQAVETTIETLEEQLTTTGGKVETFAVEDLIDEESVQSTLEEDGTMSNPETFLDEFGTEDLTVPESPRTVKGQIKSLETEIRDLESPGEDSLDRAGIKRQLRLDDIVETHGAIELEQVAGTGTSLKKILEAYVQPIEFELNDIEEQLRKRGSMYLDEREGTFQALQKLITLGNSRADGSSSDNGLSLSLSPDNVVYGPDFYRNYEDNYELPETERESTKEDSIYKVFEKAETKDLTNDPPDIGESTVWNSEREDIIKLFQNSLDDIIQRQTSRNPIDFNEIKPRSNKIDDVGQQFQEFRILNTYMSRVFADEESNTGAAFKFEEIRRIVDNDDLLADVVHEQNRYYAFQLGYGNKWTITMTTFVSAATLGMIEPAREYETTYSNQRTSTSFPWRSHSLGLDGDWETWPLDDPDHDWYPHGGGYLWRDSISRQITRKMVEWGIQVEDDNWENTDVDDMLSVLNDTIESDWFESTIEIEE